MASFGRPTTSGWVWIAVTTAALIAIIALVVVILSPPAPSASTPDPLAPTEPTPQLPQFDGEFVDPAAADLGLIPQPITTDQETYIRAALMAVGTWDTTLVDWQQRQDHLVRWVTARTDEPTEASQQRQHERMQTKFANIFGPTALSDPDAIRDQAKQSAEVIYLEPVDTMNGRTLWEATIDLQRTWVDKITKEEIQIAQRWDARIIADCGDSLPPADSAQTRVHCMVWNVSSEQVY